MTLLNICLDDLLKLLGAEGAQIRDIYCIMQEPIENSKICITVNHENLNNGNFDLDVDRDAIGSSYYAYAEGLLKPKDWTRT